MKSVKFLDLKKQYESIKNEIDLGILSVIENSAFIGGVNLSEFESKFAEYQNAKYCIGVGNGTDALEIAIEALNLPAGSEIIVPANSFIASSEAVTRMGHKVVFCDCDRENYTISISSLAEKITPATSAVIAVHLYGHPCDMGKIIGLVKKNQIKVIEDCAQAHGAAYKGQKVGTIGDIGTFSFYPGKNLGAYGDGGAITTNNKELAQTCRMIANHGRIEKYNHQFEGRNSRLDSLQAAILSVKLSHLNNWLGQRNKIAEYYISELSDVGHITLPVKADWAHHVYHLFVIRSNRRNDLKQFLKEKNIQTGIHYPISLPKLAAYAYCKQDREFFFANSADTQILSLPMGEHMEIEDAHYVASKVKAFLK